MPSAVCKPMYVSPSSSEMGTLVCFLRLAGKQGAAKNSNRLLIRLFLGVCRLLRKSVHGLQRYLDLKHRLPRAQTAEVVMILYKVITTERDMDQSLQQIFALQVGILSGMNLQREGVLLEDAAVLSARIKCWGPEL